MIIIKIKKLKNLLDTEHPNNINEGFEKIGDFIGAPQIGQRFYVGMSFSTSPVTELVDKKTFKTANSIYEYEKLGGEELEKELEERKTLKKELEELMLEEA